MKLHRRYYSPVYYAFSITVTLRDTRPNEFSLVCSRREKCARHTPKVLGSPTESHRFHAEFPRILLYTKDHNTDNVSRRHGHCTANFRGTNEIGYWKSTRLPVARLRTTSSKFLTLISRRNFQSCRRSSHKSASTAGRRVVPRDYGQLRTKDPGESPACGMRPV